MSDQMLQAFRQDAEHAVPPADFGALERRGARRRLRRRATGAVAVAAVLAVVGSLTLLDERSAPAPSPATDGDTGFPLVKEGSDGRIPPGRSELPPITWNEPRAAVTVMIPDVTRGWGQNLDQSGIYSRNASNHGWLHLATYIVEGVVERPCRQSFIPLSGSVPGFAEPGPTTQDLAEAIAGLPRGKVLSPPRTVEKWGTTAIHVRVEIVRTECRNGNRLFIFDTARGGESMGNLDAVMDFWIVRVNGQNLVVEAEAPTSATRAERRALARMAASVQLHEL